MISLAVYDVYGHSQWPRGLRRRPSAVHLLILWVRIPPGAWMFVCCECCVLSDRGLCDELITRPEDSYWLWRVVVCDQKASKTRRLKPASGLWKIKPHWVVTPGKQTYDVYDDQSVLTFQSPVYGGSGFLRNYGTNTCYKVQEQKSLTVLNPLRRAEVL